MVNYASVMRTGSFHYSGSGKDRAFKGLPTQEGGALRMCYNRKMQFLSYFLAFTPPDSLPLTRFLGGGELKGNGRLARDMGLEPSSCDTGTVCGKKKERSITHICACVSCIVTYLERKQEEISVNVTDTGSLWDHIA